MIANEHAVLWFDTEKPERSLENLGCWLSPAHIDAKNGRDLSLENTTKLESTDGKTGKGNARSKRTITYQ